MKRRPNNDVGAQQLCNRLLTGLSPRVCRRISQHLEPIEYTPKQYLYEANMPITHVHFVDTGVASVVMNDDHGNAVEVATVGNEGFVGTPLLLGTNRSPAAAFCQVPGHGHRMTANAFLSELRKNDEFSAITHRYVQALMNLYAQSAACNRLHTIEKRAARWLLMTHDRVAADTFPLTQEFLAQMLGVRRAGVNVAAGILQQAGAISYSRGIITVVNRRALEKASCLCYSVIRREFDRLIGRSRQNHAPSAPPAAAGAATA
jgi:CRP-like cAMP-binding protein